MVASDYSRDLTHLRARNSDLAHHLHRAATACSIDPRGPRVEVEPVRCGRVAARCAGPTGPRHRSRRRHRGQSLLEAALGLPLVLVLALGTADGGRAFYYREAVSNAARQALRVAVSQAQRSTGDAVCAGTTTATAKTVSATIPANGTNPNIDTIINAAGQESS